MARWRRPGADEILLVFLVLATTGYVLSWVVHSYYSHQNPLWAFLSTAFVTWRVSRGGRISRALLILGSVASYATVVLALARSWGVAAAALVIICAAQTALVASPPVYARTRPTLVQVRAPGWTPLARRPPSWLLPWGLLAGAIVTAASLANMHVLAIPGCRPAASDACSALAEGYPLHWLTARQNLPLISKDALLKDWAQWALASTSVLYLGWLWLTAPASPAGEVACARNNDLAQIDADASIS